MGLAASTLAPGDLENTVCYLAVELAQNSVPNGICVVSAEDVLAGPGALARVTYREVGNGRKALRISRRLGGGAVSGDLMGTTVDRHREPNTLHAPAAQRMNVHP